MIRGDNTIHMNGDADDPVVTEKASDWSTVVDSWSNQKPTHLKESAGNSACCIFRFLGRLSRSTRRPISPASRPSAHTTTKEKVCR